MPAVEVLLTLGADSLTKLDRGKSRGERCALDLTALLTLPDILEISLTYLDDKPNKQTQIFDKQTILQAAQSKSIFASQRDDTQSRLVRCGAEYKISVLRTFQLLRKNKVNIRTTG